MTIDYKIIGRRIRKLRTEKSLTQEKLAEMCDLSISHISLIETAKRNVGLETLIDLGNSLGVTVDTFLKGYQKNELTSNQTNFISIIENCSCYEKQMFCEIAMIIKKTNRNNF